MKTLKTLAFSFDGKGINDASDPYKPRLATLTEAGHKAEIGPALEALPDLLTAAVEVARTELFLGDHPQRQAAFEALRKAVVRTRIDVTRDDEPSEAAGLAP